MHQLGRMYNHACDHELCQKVRRLIFRMAARFFTLYIFFPSDHHLPPPPPQFMTNTNTASEDLWSFWRKRSNLRSQMTRMINILAIAPLVNSKKYINSILLKLMLLPLRNLLTPLRLTTDSRENLQVGHLLKSASWNSLEFLVVSFRNGSWIYLRCRRLNYSLGHLASNVRRFSFSFYLFTFIAYQFKLSEPHLLAWSLCIIILTSMTTDL